MATDSIKLYTWVDIKDYFIQCQENEKFIDHVSVEVLPTGVYLSYTGNISLREVKKWLKSLFPTSYSSKSSYITLEKTGASFEKIPVTLEEEERVHETAFLPSFSRQQHISKDSSPIKTPETNEVDPVMITTHSFKGGVGRTLHALTIAARIEEIAPTETILFVDADFEAPGTSWLTPDSEICFIDILNIVHSSEKPFGSIDYISRKIENQKNGNIYFLPAFRTERQLRSLEIKPEDVFRFSKKPFVLTDYLIRLANSIKASYVIIDLRAGISELSSGWLLDPRTTNVFVSTLNSQSVEGASKVFELLASIQNKFDLSPKYAPFVIISQVNRELVDKLSSIWHMSSEDSSSTSTQNMASLRDSYLNYCKSFDPELELLDDSIVISPHYESLLALSNNWNNTKALIRSSGLINNVSTLTDSVVVTSAEAIDEEDDLVAIRNTMANVLPNLIYAEGNLPSDYYRSNPIRALAERNRTRLPNLVVVGAKGSGKTFLYRQIKQAENWQTFLNRTISLESLNGTGVEATIVPVTFPEQLESKTKTWVRHVKPLIANSLEKDLSLIDWRNIWLDVVAWSCDFNVGHTKVGDKFIDSLDNQESRYVFLFDGLEDLFQNYDQTESQQLALRALLQELPSYISVIPNAPIGIITFIRRDILEYIIKQNLGQFLDRYKDYELKWNRVEALRLVAWIITHYSIYKLDITDNEILSANEDKLVDSLYPLWGRKLGSDKSREARSANKILNTLSNFNEEVQSRDLVRFLAEAIKEEVATLEDSYGDRILNPKSIKQAFPAVGKEKVSEVKQENKGNRYFFTLDKLERMSAELKVPFEDSNQLSNEDVRLLTDQGILKRYNNRYYMAELFRLGLGIGKGSGKVKTEF